ncbi:unnamed protein product [Linum tenue]|uniref:Peptide deformylase n=1 Tax=Linum tenue TaxID=586396 RepID=A0AAV0PVI5_9ROSI|nr:unnamed protein product [Linum tenue]
MHFKPALPEIVKASDPVLHEPARVADPGEISSERIQKIIDDMVKVMRLAPGVELAAPQIGIPLRVSSQWLSCFMGFPVAVFDGFRALVERSLEVEVTGLSRDGAPIKVEASGWQAGILQNSTNVIIWMERFMWIRWLKASERRSPVGPIPSTFT